MEYHRDIAKKARYTHFMSLLKALIKQINNDDNEYTEVSFENDIFVMRSYSEWDGEPFDDDHEYSEVDLPNFEHKRTGTKVAWYKHIGRGMVIEEHGNFIDIVRECFNSLKVNQDEN